MRAGGSRLPASRLSVCCPASENDGLTGFTDYQQGPSSARARITTRRWAALCLRALATLVATWIVFGSSPAIAAENVSQLPLPAPMCGADGTTVEAPPTLRSASGDELSAPCSQDLMRLAGTKSDQPSKDALWVAQAQVDHAVLLFGEPMVLNHPELLSYEPAPEMAPFEHPAQVYRPPRS